MPTDLLLIARDLAAANLDIDKVQHVAVVAAARGLEAAALLLLMDADALKLAELEHPDPQLAWEIRRRHAEEAPELVTENEVAADGQTARSGGELHVALRVDDQVLGVLSVTRAADFDEADQAWLEGLARLASLSLRTARQVRRLEREVERRGRADQERLRLERQLARTDRIQSLGAMAGGVAHDFNNLLVGVLGNASLALLDLDEEHPATASVQEIQGAAEDLAGLTAKLLAFSGHGRFISQPVGISEWIHAEGLRLATATGPTLVEVDLAEHLPRVQADPGQLGELLYALVANAMESGAGVVRIRTCLREQRDLQDGWLPDAVPPGAYVLLEVSDDGSGMGEATRKRAFDPFFTTKERSRGLGLSACLGIVRGHNGWVRLQTGAHLGTRVTVLLPPMVSEVQIPAEASAVGGRRVLVVDEGIVRRLARRVLVRSGYLVEAVASGEAGLRALEDGPVDLVLLDMTMPGLGGPATLSCIRERFPGLPVLLSSGYSERAALRRLEPHRPEGFLPKPWTGTELTAAVERLLERPSTA